MKSTHDVHEGTGGELYRKEEMIRLPLVKVDQRLNSVDAFVVGEIVLSISRPVHENVPKALRYPSHVQAKLNPETLHQYYQRLVRFLQRYDPSGLQALHRLFFDVEVGSGKWAKRLPALMKALVQQWGPEPALPKPLMGRGEEDDGEDEIST